MLKTSAVRRLFNYNTPKGSVSALATLGGLPFYGNMYMGKADTRDGMLPQGGHTKAGSNPFDLGNETAGYMPGQMYWQDPNMVAQMKKCPYFALCDQVMHHNMEPAHLDPGLLTRQEHQLLLLYSRAYFEKWWKINSKERKGVPYRMRLSHGSCNLTHRILDKLGVTRGVQRTLVQEFMFDDSQLIGMNPAMWLAASLDEFNRDHLSGRVLEFAGLTSHQRKDFHTIISQMRRLYVQRNDQPGKKELLVIPFEEIITLWQLNERLGLKPYSDQIKTFNFVDHFGTKMTMSIQHEDQYFDFLYTCFYKSNLELTTLGDLAGADDCATMYSLSVEPPAPKGRWL